MSKPFRLTLGIPTFDRHDYVQETINSCLAQTLPVAIIVAQQGTNEKTAKIMARYNDHPTVKYIHTNASCLQENWNAVAKACETEFFAWVQDDDDISEIYSDRVVKAFDAFPKALHWQAKCQCTPDRIHSVWWGCNGPQIGINTKRFTPLVFPGEFCVGSAYLMSWALSPGVAFRCGPAFWDAVDAMPTDCDLFAERLILAEMGSRGPGIADPLLAGYWYHHGQNESYKQNSDGSIERQTDVMVANLDRLCDATEDWAEALSMWCRFRSPLEPMKWLSDLNEDKKKSHPIHRSKHSQKIMEALGRSLEGRVEIVPSVAPDTELANHRAELVWN